ncbi:MAG: ArsB/NhaD family transporter [Clostridia bacterium]|nr:ArsB/NhaD family transporter [Clostridia bacterium]
MIIALSIFVITYGMIISEKINRTTIAVFGATILLLFKVLTQEQAIENIDFNTIGLLIGMMIIVSILRKTGAFEYLAIKIAKKVKGDPWKIIVLFSVFTAVASALLDNVTTILLIIPITLVITDTLEVSPIPFIFPLILVSNIGGTATLIGDPPNIMIGGAAGLGFVDFIVNLAPVIIIIFVVVTFVFKLKYKKKMAVSQEKRDRIMELNEKLAIKDLPLLKKGIFVLSLTIIGFMLHQYLHFESATVALIGAALYLLISKADTEEILLEIEWPTIFFFIALFVLVGGLKEVGVINFLAEKLLSLTQGNMFFLVIFVLWGSAIISSFLDNIPFVATMIPLITSIAVMSSIDITPLWWALSLGACLGGNGTLVGASANVIAVGMLDKHGYKLSFIDFFKTGFPIMLLSILLSTVYLIIMYL